VVSSGPFVFHVRRREPSEIRGPRLGMILPKRVVRRAVQRNQLKRWIRPLIPHYCGEQDLDLLVRLRGSIDLSGVPQRQRAKEELVLTFEKWVASRGAP